MLYWLENVKRCPEDGYPFKKPSKYARHNSAKDVRIAVYECPSCRRTFLKYPGAQIAAATDTSTYYLSIHERDKVKAQKEENLLKYVTVEDVRKFGMIPEFLGRLPILFSLEALTEDMLVRILKEPKNAIIKQYQKLLALDEVKLDFDDDALHAIAKMAKEKKVGARALRAILEEFMLDIMYEIPKDDNIGAVTITREYIEKKGGPLIQMRGVAELPVT